MDRPTLIPGDLAVDDRGIVRFVNDFRPEGVRRFYVVENFSPDTIRAFHGHLKEAKYLHVVRGSALVAVVKLDDPRAPKKDAPVERFVLSSIRPAILAIPPGYAHGFRPLEPGTSLLVFSTATIEESRADDLRFPAEYWGESVWQVENR